jgi:protein-S-isoprenylcysteine O-methyltransferase Ste14
MDSAQAFLARRRVTLGFIAAFVALTLARPSWRTWLVGLGVSCVGEALRVWAAGHLEKGREVTRTGPYRWTRHPLYVGSGIVALGVVIAARSSIVAVVAAAYLGLTLTAAIRTEEAHLRQTFGDLYDQYARSAAPATARRFSARRAWANREQRAVAGLSAGFGLLALKILLNL